MMRANVPKIRFKGFHDEWEKVTFKNIGHFYYGKSAPKWSVTEDAKTPCVRYGELYTKFDGLIDQIYSYTNIPKEQLKLSKGGEVLIPRVGEDPLDFFKASLLTLPNVAIGEMISVFNTEQNGLFVVYYIRAKLKKTFADLVEGGNVSNLYFSFLEDVGIAIPSLIEQEKISSFLSLIDQKISLLTQKHELLTTYKKSVMQKIFNQEIRFKDINDRAFPDWESRTLGSVAKFFSGGTPLTSNSKYFGGEIPFIKSGEISSSITAQKITEEGLRNSSAKLVNVGDLLYALYGATSGEVAISKISGAINQAVLCIRSELHNYFLLSYLSLFKKNITQKYIQGGQGNLSADIVKKLIIPIPCVEEQKKIALFLSGLDDKIANVQEKIALTKQYKQGLLQQMFI